MSPISDDKARAAKDGNPCFDLDILIVDDETANLRLLTDLLEKEGYRVRPAERPQMAIDAALAKPPGLILLDVRMPEMDGFEVCRRLREDESTRNVPIIFISAARDNEDRISGFEAGGVDFITKPFQEQEVLARVRAHIRLHQMQEHLERLVAERTAQLQESEERFRNLMEQSPLAIEILAPDGQIIQVNIAWMGLWGVNEEETEEVLANYNMLADKQTVDIGIAPLIRKAFAGEAVILPPFEYDGPGLVNEMGLGHLEPCSPWIECHLFPVKNAEQEVEFVVNTYVDLTERKRAETDLERTREYTDHLIQTASIMIVSLDVEGRVTHFNPTAERITGYTESELIGRNWFELLAPRDRYPCVYEVFERLRKDGLPRPLENPILTKDGQERFISWSHSAVRRDGKVIGTTSFGIDITERRQIEKALSESRKRLLKAETIARMGFLDWNLKTNEMVWSSEVYDLYGIAPETRVTVEQTVDLVHPDDRAFVKKNLDMALQGKVIYDIDHRIVRADGKIVWVHSRADLERDSEGAPTALMGTVADITERKLAEDELARSEERFRSLVEQSPLAVQIFTLEGRIVQVNDAWRQLWGLNEEETACVLATYNVFADKQEEDLGVAPLIGKAFTGESVVLPPIEYNANRMLADIGLENAKGRSVWIQCHLYPVIGTHGVILNVVATYVDLTERRRRETEARRQREALARIDRAASMGQLTGAMAHELNQPLTGILSNAQAAELMIKNDFGMGDELTEVIADIVADTKRAGDVIRNLRELYREQKGEVVPVDVNAVVEETTHLLHSEFVMQHVTLTTRYAPSVPKVDGNKIQFQQVLVNLIMNGDQAMSSLVRDKRRLHIATAYDANEVKVWVEDSGPGIDPAHIERIFKPLATWKPGGMGMGLAISNSIIAAHGGRMWAENMPEGGARVGFIIPVPSRED